MAIRQFHIGGKDVPFKELAVFKSKKEAFAELKKRLESEKKASMKSAATKNLASNLRCVHTLDNLSWGIYDKL